MPNDEKSALACCVDVDAWRATSLAWEWIAACLPTAEAKNLKGDGKKPAVWRWLQRMLHAKPESIWLLMFPTKKGHNDIFIIII